MKIPKIAFTKTSKLKRKEAIAGWCFILPGFIGFLVLYFIPFFMSLYYSFVDNPISMEFVGIDNYINLFQNEIFQLAAWNTVIFMCIALPLCLILALCLSLLLNKKLFFRRSIRVMSLTQIVVPVASMVLFWQIMFSNTGAVNGVLDKFGLSPINFFGSGWARMVIILIYTWKNIGFGVLVFLGALQNVPVEYYEAAELDGANAWKKFVHITLVYLVPSIFFTFIILFLNSFKIFREIYLIAGEYPHESIYMIQHFMNNMFITLDYQKLTSAAIIIAFVVGIVVWFIFKIEKKLSDALS